MLGFPIHSGLADSGSPDSSVYTIFKELCSSTGTEDLFQTIFGIQKPGERVELILEEDIWEMPWQMYPVRQEGLHLIQQPTERPRF
jgi:hypothetical protein